MVSKCPANTANEISLFVNFEPDSNFLSLYKICCSVSAGMLFFLLITFHFATAMAWDIPRAIFTAALIALTGSPILAALRRTYTRAAFVEPIEFSERVKA